MVNIFKNKIVMIISFLIGIVILLVVFNIVVNLFSTHCSSNSDCVFFESKCACGCGGDPINKFYIQYLKLEKNVKCYPFRSFFYACSYCSKENSILYCNEAHRCDAKSQKIIIFDNLISTDKEVYIPPEITIYNGESTILIVGLRNKKDRALNYKIKFIQILDTNNHQFDVNNLSWFNFDQNKIYELPAPNLKSKYTNLDVKGIRLNIPKDVSFGTYNLKLQIIDSDLSPPNNIYVEQDFPIIIRK